MPSYMLLLHSDPTHWREMSPQDMQKALEKFVAWRRKLQASGILVSSHKLTDDAGKVMRGGKQIRVTDGPYSEAKEVLGGYFLIKANNYEAAIDCSRECPAMEYGGTIELRQVDDTVPNG